MHLPFWKRPDHRLPTLGLYRRLLKATLTLPADCVHQPGPCRQPILVKGQGPPGSHKPLPKIQRSYIFSLIRDEFRSHQYCTSPRITVGYLRAAEYALEKLERANAGDEAVRNELKDLVSGRTGRLKQIIEHLHELITFEPGKTTQRDRYHRLKRAHEQVWDTRSQTSVLRDPKVHYRIPLHPALFTFPAELDYYPPFKYPNQLKNQRGKFKNFGGVFLTEVTTAEGSKFPRIRGGTQPEWISMMLKSRVKQSVTRVDAWKELEEWYFFMLVEEKMMKRLGVDDVGYAQYLKEGFRDVRGAHQQGRHGTSTQNDADSVMDDIPGEQ
ncbi:hypothetical protein EDD11_005149 [Mortierella claussenii]|nr:hypothetical protein EDD11_005149 [Mortierella claussenii]